MTECDERTIAYFAHRGQLHLLRDRVQLMRDQLDYFDRALAAAEQRAKP